MPLYILSLEPEGDVAKFVIIKDSMGDAAKSLGGELTETRWGDTVISFAKDLFKPFIPDDYPDLLEDINDPAWEGGIMVYKRGLFELLINGESLDKQGYHTIHITEIPLLEF